MLSTEDPVTLVTLLLSLVQKMKLMQTQTGKISNVNIYLFF